MPSNLPAPPPSPAVVARAIAAYQRVLLADPPAPIEANWRPAPPPGQGWRTLVGFVVGAGAILLLRLILT